MLITNGQLDELVAHAREADPSECCGFLKLRDGAVTEVVPARDSRTWRYGFEFKMKDLMAIADAEDEGYEVAIYHSHPRSAPEPSQQDVNMWAWPYLCVIVSLMDGRAQVRNWRITDGTVTEEAFDVGG